MALYRHPLAGPYIVIISVLGTLGLVVAAAAEVARGSVLIALLLVGVAMAAEAARITIRSGRINVSLSAAVILASVAVAGPFAAVLVAAGASFGVTLFPRRRPLERIGFNLGLYVISSTGAAAVYVLAVAQHAGLLRTALALAAAGFVYFLVNWPVLTVVVHLTTGSPFSQVWREDLSWMPVPAAILVGIGGLLALATMSAGVVGAIGGVILLATLERPLRGLAGSAAATTR